MHTDAGFKGDARDLAIVDFWPNFGHRHQPGCEISNAFNKETAKNGLLHSIYGKSISDFNYQILFQIYAATNVHIYYGQRVLYRIVPTHF